ncbi:MAG: hypothetical protein ICV53_19910, partial [Flavisolibacter sp.]|nr:hypothetical protein [Flavisolibacter sp.]MBD0349745.1 hypothetical protein [Flavisolibacter sp.]MBD0366320.1 hypothetical protein [Flavisolibacter sp.]MBD0368357.1 hypothetical protein [Flavisolibacter sp.]
MGLIKEPLDVDFYFDPRPLTKEEREKISQFIREYKAKMAKRKSRKTTTKKKRSTPST